MGFEKRFTSALAGQVNVSTADRDMKSRWFGGLCFLILALACIAAISQPFQRGKLEHDNILRFEKAQVVNEGATDVVGLPNRWLNDGVNRTQKQYVVTFDRLQIGARNISLYIPTVSKNFQATLNETVIPAFGAIGSNPSWNYNRPHILTFPPALLIEGENKLVLDVYAHSVHDGMLGVFYLGDSSVLYSSWQVEWYLSIGAAFVVLFLAIIFASTVGVYSIRSDSQYRLVALACFFAALACRRWLVVDPWLSPLQHLALNELMVSSFNFISLLFLSQFNNFSPRRCFLQRMLMMGIWSIEASLFFFAEDIDAVYEVVRWTKLVTTFAGTAMLILAFSQYIKQLNLFRLVYLSSMAVLFVGGIHENLVRFAIFDMSVDYRYQWCMFFLLSASFTYFLLDAIRQSEEFGDFRGDLEHQLAGFGDQLETARQHLVETQQWSVLGYSSMQLWRKLKSPLKELFESSSYLHSKASENQRESHLIGLSYRSMYSAQRCLRTIDEMELLVGEPVVEMIELDMERWAPELLRELHKHFRVELRLGVVDRCTVSGDPYLLRDCIERFVENADRACEGQSKRGIVEVSVWVSSDEVVLSVSDNGPGISAALVARLQEPLHRGEPNGLGVGLCIVKHYAQLMGIEVRSSPLTQGACMELVFPRLD